MNIVKKKMSVSPTGSGPAAELVPVEESHVSVDLDLEILTGQSTNPCGILVSN